MFKRFIEKIENAIARKVAEHLSAPEYRDRFLPPVVVRDTVYMVTEGGSVYAMRSDFDTGMEQIIQIQRR